MTLKSIVFYVIIYSMFIEVVHVNGQYSHESGEHTSPRRMPEGYYARLASTLARAASKGASVLYRPSLTSFTHDLFSDQSEIDRALASDPFLNESGKIEGLMICLDGQRPLELIKEQVALENDLVRRHGTAVVLGAYTKQCVPASAHNIAARNPGYPIGIDPELSIDNGANFSNPAHAVLPYISVMDFVEAK